MIEESDTTSPMVATWTTYGSGIENTSTSTEKDAIRQPTSQRRTKLQRTAAGFPLISPGIPLPNIVTPLLEAESRFRFLFRRVCDACQAGRRNFVSRR